MSAEKVKEFLLALNDKDARDAWKAKMAGTKNDGEALAAAVDLARERGFTVSVGLCLHRKNLDTLRETVRFLGSIGANSVKLSTMMELGEWAD